MPASETNASTDLLEPLMEGGDALANAEASPDEVAAPSTTTWTDTFYEKEAGIVAVFDMDTEAIGLHLKQKAVNFTFFALIFSLGLALDEMESFWSVFCAVMAFFALSVVVVACRQGWAPSAGGQHLAITNSSIRHDQENPLVSTEISLQSVNSCTVIQKEIKPYYCFGAAKKLNVVILQIAGARCPKTYVGLKDASNFNHLVMSLKNNTHSAAAGAPHMIV